MYLPLRSITVILMCLCFGFPFHLGGEPQEAKSLNEIAAIEELDERTTELRLHLQTRDSLEARLTVLEEARAFVPLQRAADLIAAELLLVSGRTEDAQRILSRYKVEGYAEFSTRLAISHGTMVLPEGKESGAPVDRESFRRLRDSVEASPEYFSHRRGAIIATALLLDPPRESEESVTPTPDATDSTRVAIQLGAFSKKANAEAHIRYLGERGIDADIRAPVDSQGVYRTVVNNVSADTAQRELIRLKEKGIEGFIIYGED